MSRGFICCLIGIALTVFSWFGPWAWPAWPALFVIESAYGTNSNFAEQPFDRRAAVVVALIVLNVAVWAVTALVVSVLARSLSGRFSGSAARGRTTA